MSLFGDNSSFSGDVFGIGSAIGGAFGIANSAYQQHWANKTNQQNQDFAREMNQTNMDFQERMSNTAHQREAADLKAAGMNPLLAANGGATTPGGSSVSSTSVNPAQDYSKPISNALQKYMDMKSLQSQLDTNKASQLKDTTQALVNASTANQVDASTQLIKEQTTGKKYENVVGKNKAINSDTTHGVSDLGGIAGSVGGVVGGLTNMISDVVHYFSPSNASQVMSK